MSEWELYFAAASGHEGRVSEFLLVDGINVNYKDSDEDSNGQSPLYNAAAYGHVNIIRLLHQAGAELEIRTIVGTNSKIWLNTEYQIYSDFKNASNTKFRIYSVSKNGTNTKTK